MSSLVRKLVIFAAVDGLILQPVNQRDQRAIPSLQIRYTTQGSATLRPAPPDGSAHSASFEAHGIHPSQGLLNIASKSYLVSIRHRQQVAQIRGSPVYVITSVALIPLSSQLEAKEAIEETKKEVQSESSDQAATRSVDSDSSGDEGSYRSDGHVRDDNTEASKPLTPPYGNPRRKSQENPDSVAQDVISRRGQYGRFAERWFSRKGWTSERRKAQGMSTDKEPSASDRPETVSDSRVKEGEPLRAGVPSGQAPLLQGQDVTSTLLPKLLRTTKMLFASKSFFYSYDYDITRRLGDQKGKATNIPLYRRVDPLFFWNQHLALPFIENSNHAYVLPLMQGFVGQRSFAIDPTPSKDPSKVISEAREGVEDIVESQKSPQADSTFLLTLISRRSVKRPGLRYLRRGVDEEGHTANSVETEQILSRASWTPNRNIHSFTQYRGSIPLFFSQSPYAFKPVPVLQHGFDTNHAAFKRHFSNLVGRYGDVQIALLVDKHGGEAEIGQQYQEHTKRLRSEGGISGIMPDSEWFDFHAVCRGMRFENVSILMDTLGDTFEKYGTTVEVNGEVQMQQTGVLRTNCMDCLDRTNVVQSACASKALEKQLRLEGVEVDLQTDSTTRWFNTLWADNGDAISKQYSSTAALKGDYTRTRKRDYRGALNDFGLTLSRYYNNIVNDYFSQAAIDYLLGNVTEQVFEEFEADMMSNDPAISMRKVRGNAIETSSKIVIAEQREDLIGGWTLLSPQQANTVRTFPFEEVILLLTDAALYAVRFDWNLEKVKSFERVDLRSVTGIIHGTYITSTLTATQMDENRNVGLVIKYRPGKEDIARINTRSLSTAVVGGPNDDHSHDNNNDEPDIARTAAIANLFDPSNPGISLPPPRRQHPFSPDANSNSSDTTTTTKFLAFKALPAKSSLANNNGDSSSSSRNNSNKRDIDESGAVVISEKELVSGICEDVRRAAYGNGDGGAGGMSDTGFGRGFVEEREIIGVQAARRRTGYLERWGYELKKFVWA
ncbi:MAG: hypothetical protein Q9223_000077 [Gallowayella weberi]